MQTRQHDFSAEGSRPVLPMVKPWEAGSSSADPQDGNKYLHARYFDPQIGNFLSSDRMHPAKPGVGINRYAYSFGNPVNPGDRSGQMVPCSGAPVGGGSNPFGHPGGNVFYPNQPTEGGIRFQDTVTVTGSVTIPDCSVFDNGPMSRIELFDLYGDKLDPTRGGSVNPPITPPAGCTGDDCPEEPPAVPPVDPPQGPKGLPANRRWDAVSVWVERHPGKW